MRRNSARSFLLAAVCLPQISQCRIGNVGDTQGPDSSSSTSSSSTSNNDRRDLLEESRFWSSFLDIKTLKHNHGGVDMSVTSEPTQQPTNSPTTVSPTSTAPTTTSPSISPTFDLTSSPTISPTFDLTSNPTISPTFDPIPPTFVPSQQPITGTPTLSPTTSPSTSLPTRLPTSSPTTASPTSEPTSLTAQPTSSPTIFFFPSGEFIRGNLTDEGGTTQGRLSRVGVPSSCDNNKEFPGVFGDFDRQFEIIGPFWNQEPAESCVFVTWDFDTCEFLGDVLAHPVAYTSFNPDDLSENYLGDAGPSDTQQFSFNVDGSSTFFMVFQQVFPGNTGIGCSFQFRVDFTFTGQGEDADFSPLALDEEEDPGRNVDLYVPDPRFHGG